ncbi:MAG: hypothetical protein NWF07_04410 [Candidatus Bathyarchaeota archaeon]|nr:hypothetical protein [Candidatus Bathyarchaeota archaeon]
MQQRLSNISGTGSNLKNRLPGLDTGILCKPLDYIRVYELLLIKSRVNGYIKLC